MLPGVSNFSFPGEKPVNAGKNLSNVVSPFGGPHMVGRHFYLMDHGAKGTDAGRTEQTPRNSCGGGFKYLLHAPFS